jgi:hypothetical protein
VGPIVLGGMLIFLADRAREVLSFYRDFIASAPDELGGGCAFVTAPPSCSYPSPCMGLRSGLHPRAQSKLEHLS